MFDICAHDLSALFWNRLLRLSAWDLEAAVGTIWGHHQTCELDRAEMDYKTGSIPLATAVWLYALAKHIKPIRAFEVGTFIGKSTLAIAEGMDGGVLFTCDASNEAPESLTSENQESSTIIECHPKTTSTSMFTKIAAASDDEHASEGDLFFFDGRIQGEDMALITHLSHDKTIYAFDDFEGTEKGVANVAQFSRKAHALIYPPAPELLAPFGVVDRSTLALLVPVGLFRFTAQ
jgi:hypothetical protein